MMTLPLLFWATAHAADPSPAMFWNTNDATFSPELESAAFEKAFHARRLALGACAVEGEKTPLTLDFRFTVDGQATTVATSPNPDVKACALQVLEDFSVGELAKEAKVSLPGTLGVMDGEPVVLGSLDKDLIDAVIKRHMKAIRHCYQQQLTQEPTLAGKVVIKFVIDPDGTVGSAQVKSATLPEGETHRCIVEQFKQMRFPKPEGNGVVIVSYPFIFSPG